MSVPTSSLRRRGYLILGNKKRFGGVQLPNRFLCAELRAAQRPAELSDFGHGRGGFALQVCKDRACLCRANGACALDALEHEAVETSSELHVALARRALPGEYGGLFHIVCLHSLDCG